LLTSIVAVPWRIRCEFRLSVRRLLDRSGLSMRQLSAAFGRDPGYVSSLLDPTRPARSRPTPEDLLRASDALAIPFTELLEALWGIPRDRLLGEVARIGSTGSQPALGDGLSDRDRASLADYASFLEKPRQAPRTLNSGRRPVDPAPPCLPRFVRRNSRDEERCGAVVRPDASTAGRSVRCSPNRSEPIEEVWRADPDAFDPERFHRHDDLLVGRQGKKLTHVSDGELDEP
jgi:transcriptional regulator with XRE-family HTH domain